MQHPFEFEILRILYDWQTLLAGLLAVGGAYLAWRGVQGQLMLSTEERRREEFAARAVLPLALSELSGYAHECIRVIDSYYPDRLSASLPAGRRVPPVSDQVISVLRDCCRYAEHEIAMKIANLLGKFQIQRARMVLFVDARVTLLTEHQINREMIDAAEIYSAVSELFAYGRIDAENLRKRSTPEKLRSALRECGLWQDDHPAMKYLDELDARLNASKAD